MTDLETRRVRGTPELLADLKKLDDDGMGTRELTDYAVTHGVELPECYGPYRFISMVWTIEGEEVGLLWNDPDGPEAI